MHFAIEKRGAEPNHVLAVKLLRDAREGRAELIAVLEQKKSAARFFRELLQSFIGLRPHAGGTELTLTDSGVPDAEWEATLAGWVSVLLALKAAADFGVDLRNHDARRTWEQNFVDN